MRTLIYARVSTDDQVERYGLPAQLRACREHAAKNNWTVVKEICDEGISGATMDRAGLEVLREIVRHGGVDVVLMLDPDRLSRELIHLLILKPEIEKRARLEFVTASFDNTPTGDLFFNLKGSIAKYERAVTRDRTMRGKRERAKSGLVVLNRAPYGYAYDGGILAPNDRADVVRRIFADYDRGASVREIVRRLRQSGARTWTGLTRWSHAAVRYILRNETYAGIAHYRTGRENITISVPELVNTDLFARVQGRLSANVRVGRPSSTFLLRGLLYCHCGRKMSPERAGTGGYTRYRCNHDDLAGEVCRTAVRADKADAAAWGELARSFGDADALRALLKDREKQVRETAPDAIAKLESQTRRLKAAEESAFSLLLDPDYVQERATIRVRHQQARSERMRAEGELFAARRAGKAPGDWLESTISLFRNDLAEMNQEGRQRFVQGIMRRADWTGEVLKMHVFFVPELGKSSAPFNQFSGLEVVLTARVAA